MSNAAIGTSRTVPEAPTMLSSTIKTCSCLSNWNDTRKSCIAEKENELIPWRSPKLPNTRTRIFERKGQLHLDTKILSWGEPNCHKKLVIAVPSHWAVLRLPVAEIRKTAMHDACQSDGRSHQLRSPPGRDVSASAETRRRMIIGSERQDGGDGCKSKVAVQE